MVRNGSLPEREILTGAGCIPVTQGRVRDNIREVLQYAFAPVRAAGFSTSAVSGPLSNVANKSLLAGWNEGDTTWRQIAQVKTSSDFNPHTSYRVLDDMPAVLRELMRHVNIATTLEFYVGDDANRTAAELWGMEKLSADHRKPNGQRLEVETGENALFSREF